MRMKFEAKESNSCPFSDLKEGELFRHVTDDIYIRTNGSTSTNAVCLQDGHLHTFSLQYVRKVAGTFIEE